MEDCLFDADDLGMKKESSAIFRERMKGMELTKCRMTKDNGILRIVMHHPDNFNAIDEQMAAELHHCLMAAEADDVRVVLLSGMERCFSAGGDIRYFYDKVEADDVGDFEIVAACFQLSDAMRRLPKPVIAAAAGAMAGAGANLALSSDFLICADNAKLIQAFVNIALAPDTGGLYLLAQTIGWRRASELVMTGRPVDAAEAKALGLAYDVVPVSELDGAATALAERLAKGPALAYAAMKTMLYEAVFQGYGDYGALEAKLQKACGHSDDFKEGVRAFIEKRPPDFHGR